VQFAGPEYAIGVIFAKARQFAPCYLIFEDLDSMVTNQVRSYFLNEVDGLKSNDGIFIVGSTNHLELLDPGISVRPRPL
jgi:transitional endoplasmic reticulum ATPase